MPALLMHTLARRDNGPGFSGWSILWLLLGIILPLCLLAFLCWLAWKAWKKHKADEEAKLQQSGLAGQGYQPNNAPYVTHGGPSNMGYPQQNANGSAYQNDKAQTIKTSKTGRW